jgi:hypothetical protein
MSVSPKLEICRHGESTSKKVAAREKEDSLIAESNRQVHSSSVLGGDALRQQTSFANVRSRAVMSISGSAGIQVLFLCLIQLLYTFFSKVL